MCDTSGNRSLGAHFCLGAALARIEGRTALEEVLRRLPEWDVDRTADDLDGPWVGHHARRPALIRARTVSGRTVARKVDITLAVLLSDDTSYVSGQFLAGDGGMVIR